MASLDSLKTNIAKAKNTVREVGTDMPVVLRLAINAKDLGVTSVTVDNSANTLVIVDNATSGTPAGTHTISLVGLTVGTLKTAIEAIRSAAGAKAYNVLALDALLSDAVEDKLVNGAVSSTVVDGVTVWDLKAITDTTKTLTVRLKAGSYVPGVEVPGTELLHRVRINEINYYATLGAAGRTAASGLKVYEVKDAVETLVLNKTSVSATEVAIYLTNLKTIVDSSFGKELVVRLGDSSTLTDADGNHLTVFFTQE